MDLHRILTTLDLSIDLAILAAILIGIVLRKVPSRWRWTVGMIALVVFFNFAQSLLTVGDETGSTYYLDRMLHAGEVLSLIGTVVVFRSEVLRPDRLVRRAQRRNLDTDSSFDAVPAIVITSSPDGVVRAINRYGKEMLGPEAQSLIGHEVFRLAGRGSARRRAKSDFMRFVGSVGVIGGESEYPIDFAGQSRTIRWRRTAQIDNDGLVIGVVSHGEDVTERRETEERLADESYLLDSVHDAVIVTCANDERLYFNRAAHDMLGMNREEFEALPPSEWISPHCRAEAQRHIEQARVDGDHLIEIVGQTKDGSELPLELRSQRIRFAHQDCVMTVLRDISSRHQAQSLMQKLAYTDALTGLANRRMVLDRLAVEAARQRRRGSSFAVLYVDVDNLKSVNDTLGHEAGDQLIRLVGERFAEVVREDDLVGRVGGDEFVIVLADVDDHQSVVDVVERLLSRLGEPITLKGRELRVSASVGVSLAGSDKSPSMLVAQADRAMYFAKRSGGHRFLMHESSMDDAVIDEITLKSDLAEAVTRSELFLEFQPIIDAATESVVAAEALVRWNHPSRGVLPPDTFIDLAEQTGAIRHIGRWVLTEACRSMADWTMLGLDLDRIAVNVSPLQLSEPDFVEDVLSTLESFGLESRKLELEITETQAMDHTAELGVVFRQLSEAGVRIALDDFGVGHSSLERLRHLPISTLKLDRTFVDDLCHSNAAHPIIETVLVLASNLRLSVVAEGVETACQAEYLRGTGCDELQGFAFAKPVSAVDLPHLAHRRIQPKECEHACERGKGSRGRKGMESSGDPATRRRGRATAT